MRSIKVKSRVAYSKATSAKLPRASAKERCSDEEHQSSVSFISCFIHRCKKNDLVDFPFPEISPDDVEIKLTIMLGIASANYEGKKIVPMGLLTPDPTVHDHDEGMDIISWLGEKAKLSMVIVSFGSEEDMEEISHG
ncbi:hypothetical protein FNV43_RR25506 [Rhamnella rubrinervis]|uniref:Uncharacterized protein n=1 Tax=Rhamnella rubrinervis TaxID=2594499 RepID=A0A8K0DUC8_9ROSA|nr:hypothetical protein FNV43_RR25506 [Rhamnella rubrinervis]